MSVLLNSEQVIRRLYQITNSYDKGFNQQMNELLQMGIDRFHLDIGIFSKIDIDKDIYMVENCITPPDIHIQAGDIFDYNLTYCKITCSANGPVAFEHVGEDEEVRSHPAYKALGLESYIGIPIHFEGKIYGTLNFSSPSPAPHPFRDIDIDALQLMASWIEVELVRREQEKNLILLNKKLDSQANYDSLTNLPNRRYMYKNLQKSINHLTRLQGKATLALIDIDYFKKVNDTYGHQKGDEVLVVIAQKISDTIRDYDFVARFGGEEFLLWLPDSDYEGAAIIFQRIIHSVSDISLIAEPLTLSIGAFHLDFKNETYDEIPKFIDDLIGKADNALYQAKTQGRNRVVNYTKHLFPIW